MSAALKPENAAINGTPEYDVDFLDDMLGVFPDHTGYAPKSGKCGKYIYAEHNWGDFIAHSENYVQSNTDAVLMQEALNDCASWGVPDGASYVDFGVGGAISFKKYALPIMKRLRSNAYYGVDYCEQFLQEIKALQPELEHAVTIKTQRMDFFAPTNKRMTGTPSLGVMNGLTLGNIEGSLNDGDIAASLVTALKYLLQLCGHGWLLVSIDTNQNEAEQKKAYLNPENESFCLNVLHRMKQELPTEGFDPCLFSYDVEFHAEKQLLAHMAYATATQDFKLASHLIHVEAGQRIHLFNSYKYTQEFFESCCLKAGVNTVKCWTHKTGVMLYLLKDATGS